MSSQLHFSRGRHSASCRCPARQVSLSLTARMANIPDLQVRCAACATTLGCSECRAFLVTMPMKAELSYVSCSTFLMAWLETRCNDGAGMPIHINGYFELSSNRRDICHASLPSEDSGASKHKSDWNIALLQVREIVLFWTVHRNA